MEYTKLRPLTGTDFDLVSREGKGILSKADARTKGFAHGDYNSNVSKNSGKMVLVDFDWSGKADKHAYPPFMNLEIK